MLQATPSKLIIYPGNSQVIQLDNLFDIITSTYLNNASLTATLYDSQGNSVQGCIGIALTYVAASNGSYLGLFGDSSFTPNPGTGYTLIVDGTASGGQGTVHAEYIVEVKARQT